MSLKIPSATLTPSTVYTGAQLIISVEIYDDVFQFSDSANVVTDTHQGFADIDQTMGGKFET